MSDMYWEQEEQIIKALNALRNEEYSSVRAAALAFGITSYVTSTLKRKRFKKHTTTSR